MPSRKPTRGTKRSSASSRAKPAKKRAASKKVTPQKKVAAASAVKAKPKPKTKPKAASRAPKNTAGNPTEVPEMVSVDGYVHALPSPMQMIVQRLRQLVREAAPEALETFRWAQPVYEANGPFAYVKAHSKYVNFGFWRGAMLDNTDGVLEGEGDETRHVKLSSLEDVKTDILRTLVRQAVLLNVRHGAPAEPT